MGTQRHRDAEKTHLDRAPCVCVSHSSYPDTRHLAPGTCSDTRHLTPDTRAEQRLWALGLERVAGVDEVGIGCICGPVVAAAVVLPVNCRIIAGVRDSKLLTAERREELLPEILGQAIATGVGAASVAEIERLNVRRASHLAMRRALRRIGRYDHALVDGKPIVGTDLGPHTTIVDGDATCYAIACASIVAKVVRDRLMGKLAGRFPHYGWDHNVGYGTPEHLDALRTHGLTPYHRLGYTPVREIAESSFLAK